MTYSATIIADSIPEDHGPDCRLITVEATYPLIIHAQILTHRTFSRNTASHRAIPLSVTLRKVGDDPFFPVRWGANQSGMVAEKELTPEQTAAAIAEWDGALYNAIRSAEKLAAIGVHKEIANRLLVPFSWTTAIITANHRAWRHFFAQRCHPHAQAETQEIARMIRDAVAESKPVVRPMGEQRWDWGDWHLPYVTDEERADGTTDWPMISAGRCARVSYLTHDGKRDINKDFDLADRLINDGHWSPLEHQACTSESIGHIGNLGEGWDQLRKRFEGEFIEEAAE